MRPIISQMPPPRCVAITFSFGSFSNTPRTIMRATASAPSIGRPTDDASR